MKPILTFFALLSALNLHGQTGVAINDNSNPADQSAMLDIQSSSKGILIPRVSSAQRTAIASPANGLLVFDNTTQSFWFYSSTWVELVDDVSGPWKQDGDTLSTQTPLVGIGTDSPSRMLSLKFNNANVNTSQFLIEQQGTGDSWFNIGLTGSTHYAMGVDNSDGDKFKIGYNATSPGPLHVTPRFTIDAEGDVGIGSTTMAERLVVNSIAAQDPFRADVNGTTKFKLNANGGASIGSSITPPVNGLHVTGGLNPAGGISSSGNIPISSTAGYISITAGGAEIRLYASGQIDITSPGALNITSGGTLTLSGNAVDILSNTSIHIESDAGMLLEAGSSMDILAQSTMDIQNNAGAMNIKNLGGTMTVQASATLNLDGATVDINNGTKGAARVDDPVNSGVILMGSSTVKIGN